MCHFQVTLSPIGPPNDSTPIPFHIFFCPQYGGSIFIRNVSNAIPENIDSLAIFAERVNQNLERKLERKELKDKEGMEE
jgi:hypothetical protein